MRVTPYNCGPAANESEQKAFEHLKSRLLSIPGDDEWILLMNLMFSVTHQLQADEIDLVAIGPSGVRVIEIKHWAAQWIETHKADAEAQADKLTMKARKVGGTLQRVIPDLPFVEGVILSTEEPSRVKKIAGQRVRGVQICTLNDWKIALGFDNPPVLTSQRVKQLAAHLQPKSMLAVDGSLRRLAGYVNLELQTPKDERFHRVYKGSHPARRDRVVLHLYDLSATDDKNAEAKAMREFAALHRLQLYPWAPRILDSYQDAPGYEGEMFFFTVVDPAAPSIAARAADTTWTTSNRLAFARSAVRALHELHAAGTADNPIVHRNLTPATILVKHDNSPIFTGFERTKLPSEVSVASTNSPTEEYSAVVAPEVRAQGLAAADYRSDLYSLAACMTMLFETGKDELSRQAIRLFAAAAAVDPNRRGSLPGLDAGISGLLGESVAPPPPPPARYWTEEQVIRFRDSDYRIISRLGTGGVGTAFKVVELDRHTGEELGTYVAKVVHEGDTGRHVVKAYSLVRSHLHHTSLSVIYEIAKEWHENEFVALLKWISGTPLDEFATIFPLLAEEQQEASSEALALRWIRSTCEALDVLHKNGFIHGDVSPRNLIVSGSDLVLTDFDFATKIDEPIIAPATIRYCSPSHQIQRPASPSDDIYALAASLFYVVFGRDPFNHDGAIDKSKGLNWAGLNREQYPILAAFLDKATHPDPQCRYARVTEALSTLQGVSTSKARLGDGSDDLALEAPSAPHEPEERHERSTVQTQELSEEHVEWLRSLLQSYPGSRWGNSETRGLDTEFAAQTYVETELERTLVADVLRRRVRLVVLCGNAGDGKTALLQHLALRLNLGKHPSSERILEGQSLDGPLVRMNLDGSAAWQGRSADRLLDEFLEPFQFGPPDADIVHLLAINDGRLLEWLEGAELRRSDATPLTTELYDLLQQEAATQDSHIRFISLNQRSLVGGVTSAGDSIDTAFLDKLMDQMYGGENAAAIWLPCQKCSAKERCEVFRAAQYFGPDDLFTKAEPGIRARVRQRLFEALQAVHLRAETHITMRELRAALVYILFGLHFCDDYHAESAEIALPYWDRAFLANSPARQGEVLAELARFDPALESHPKIDRHLLGRSALDGPNTAPRYPILSLESARRRAYFEWTSEDIDQIAEDATALDLARSRHLSLFRDLPLADKHGLAAICAKLCKGISRLEDLPPQALDRPDVVPLRVTPRTPTETAFWVEKPLSAFELKTDLPPFMEGIERMHRQARLEYHYRDGHNIETLHLGAELFHLLLELADGYQLGDSSTDDTFAHLSIFVQRLVREDERELLAWNPMNDEAIYTVTAVVQPTDSGLRQHLTIASAPVGVEQ